MDNLNFMSQFPEGAVSVRPLGQCAPWFTPLTILVFLGEDPPA